jgi:homoserine kinase type II
MGVQTKITLQEAQKLFPQFKLKTLKSTSDGVMDTTYLLENYILKHYERKIDLKLQSDKNLLALLYNNGLDVPLHIASSQGWHLYSRLRGSSPKNIGYFHIQALARFFAKMHKLTQGYTNASPFLAQYKLKDMLDFCKAEHYFYYKKLHSLQNFSLQNNGFIHGDLFKDNTLFEGQNIKVFDFIDGGLGEFSFDIGVALVAFNPNKRKSYTKLFLNTYNQNASKKITLHTLEKQITNAAKLYALLRIQKYKNPQKAKALTKLW